MFSDWRIAIFGAFGGVAAPLLTMAQNLQNGGPNVPSILSWLLGVLILGVLGGGIAVALRERTPVRALVLGLSLPATITSLAKNNQLLQEELGQPGASKSEITGSLISAAFAQQSRTMTVEDWPNSDRVSIIFYDAQGNAIGTPLPAPQLRSAVPVPDAAASIAVSAPDGRSLPKRLPPVNFKLDVEARSDFVRGFKSAFGADANRYEVDID